MAPPIIKRYLIAVDQYKWVGIATFTLILGISGVVALQPRKPPTYTATGLLQANRPTISFSAAGDQILEQGLQVSAEALTSRDVIEPVATKLEMNPNKLARDLRVKVSPATGPNPRGGGPKPLQVTVTYTGDDPRQAANAINLLLQGMIEQSRLNNSAKVRAIIQSLEQRIPQVNKELQQAEQNLERYDRVEGPALMTALNGTLINSITTSQQQQRQLELALQGIETQMAGLQQKLGLNPNQAFAASALSADPIIANLRAQVQQTESQLEILSRDLRPEHPSIMELQKRRDAFDLMLQRRANELLSGNNFAAPITGGEQIRRDSSLDPTRQQFANQLVQLQTQRETFRQQILGLRRSEQQLRATYATIPNKQLARTRLEQQVTLKRALNDKMQAALVDARSAEAETVSSLAVASSADVNTNIPPAPNIPLTLGAGVLIGLLAGGGLIFLLNTLEGKFYTLEELRDAIRQREVPLLGVLPLIPPSEVNTDDIPVILDLDSPYLEYYERLRSNLRRIDGKNLKVLLIASTLADEGKTVTAYNLAIASARAGKRTLLIEADLRSPSSSRALKVAVDPESQIEPLRYYGQVNDCVRLVPQVENLYLVPSPGPQQQAAALVESSEMQRLLKDVRGRFDLVILDTSALSLCNDALLLEPATDGIVLITRPGYTQSSLLSEAIEQLSESDDIQFLGAVVNGTDITPRARPAVDPALFSREEETVFTTAEPARPGSDRTL